MYTVFVENGLRKIVPYFFPHETFVKGRWIGKTVLEVMSSEFREFDAEHYERMINKGHLAVRANDVLLSPELVSEHKLKNKDVLLTYMHRHETPVKYVPQVSILYEDEKLVVVDKPSGIPVHPTARYYYNSVTEILKRQCGYANLYPVHRLDKLTSGVLLIAKDTQTAKSLQQAIANHDLKKHYLARVTGKFPDVAECKDDVFQIEPHKPFIAGVTQPREAYTSFELVKYFADIDQSVVKCYPLTGRTHQIRIHLRNLGHPIVNDPIYGPKGSDLRNSVHNISQINEALFNEIVAEDKARRNKIKLDIQVCPKCDTQLWKDPSVEEMVLWLHAYTYGEKHDGGWCYTTEAPEWSTNQ